MSNIKIFSDSTCDLTKELIEKYNIGIVPLYVNFDETSFVDGITITTEELYKKVDELGRLPKTAASSPADFYKAFKPFIDAGDDIVFIGLSSCLSSHIQNARLAAAEFFEDRVHIVDSLNLSSGIGLLLLKACDFRDQGMKALEIAEEVTRLIPKVKTAFVIDTLEYLYKGGRCSALQNFMGGMLRIRPIVKVVDGKMILSQKLIGKREKALNTMLNNVIKEKDIIDPSRVMVTHSISHDAPYLISELEKHIDVKEIIVTQAGCVISSHCGPNAIGILYLEKG